LCSCGADSGDAPQEFFFIQSLPGADGFDLAHRILNMRVFERLDFDRLLLPVLLIVAAAFVAWPVHAELRTITWQDLIPEQVAFDDPFEELTGSQLVDLGLVARIRRKQASGLRMASEDRDELAATEEKLTAQGIDIDGLLARRSEITEKRRQAAEAVVPALDGANVRIAGYLLPIEFEGDKVTEFLLVPFVGACIHVPPPPANQIVHVRYEEGFTTRGLFAPVWVNGAMATRLSRENLHLVDGAADVSVGYRLVAKAVESYRQ
jgi:uncharacterized protein